jgi:hypothetical protein
MRQMSIREAVDVLRRHNSWRRGDDADALDPRVISRAIDAVVAHHDGLRAKAVVGGLARAARLSAERRSAIGRKGGKAKAKAWKIRRRKGSACAPGSGR